MVDISISILPIITGIIAISAVLVILAAYFTSKTKRATNESDQGYFNFVFTNGEFLEGQVTLAQKLMQDEYVQILAAEGHIKNDEAKSLVENYLKKHYFYAFRSGRLKYLIISSVNITDTQYHISLDQRFVFPFGFQSVRMVIANVVVGERGGWQVRNITPLAKGGEFTSTEIYKTMQDLGEAAAVIKQVAIRIKDDIPYREMVESSRDQLREAQQALAEKSAECDLAYQAAGLTPLSGGEPTETPTPAKKKGWVTLGRLIAGVICFLVPQFLIVPYFAPSTDPFLISLTAGVIAFLVFPWIRSKFDRWI